MLHDPLGNRVEIFHGPEIAADPFVPGRKISGFRTGPLGWAMRCCKVEKVDEVMPFYRDLLGFRLSDYYFQPFTALLHARQSAPSQPRLRPDRARTPCIT